MLYLCKQKRLIGLFGISLPVAVFLLNNPRIPSSHFAAFWQILLQATTAPLLANLRFLGSIAFYYPFFFLEPLYIFFHPSCHPSSTLGHRSDGNSTLGVFWFKEPPSS